MEKKINIAILDDDVTHTQIIEQSLLGDNHDAQALFKCTFFKTGRSLLEVIDKQHFDCLVLDRQLPDVSGDEVLRYIRRNVQPYINVIVVSSLSGEEHVSELLKAGADDYLSKPFSGATLLEKVKQLSARPKRFVMLAKNSDDSFIDFESFQVQFNSARYLIRHHDVEALCTPLEFALALFLLHNTGRTLSRSEIYEAVWLRRNVSSSRAVDTLVHRVRIKLHLNPENGFTLHPIYGLGYRLDILEAS